MLCPLGRRDEEQAEVTDRFLARTKNAHEKDFVAQSSERSGVGG